MKKIIALSLGLSIGFSALAQVTTPTDSTPVAAATAPQAPSTSVKEQATNLMKQIVEKNRTKSQAQAVVETSPSAPTNAPVAAPTLPSAESKPSSPTLPVVKEEVAPQAKTAKNITAPEVKKSTTESNVVVKKMPEAQKPSETIKPELPKVSETTKLEPPKTTDSKLDAPMTTTSINTQPDVNCEPPQAVEKKVVKKKRYVKPKVAKKQENIEKVPEKSVLTEYSSFHIPSNAQIKDEDYHKFSTPITYEDVEHKHNLNEKSLTLSLIDKRTNASLDEYYFNESNKNVELLVLNSDLSNAKEHSIEYKTNSKIEINNEKFNDGCKIILGKYQLKTEDSETGFKYFLNNGQSVEDLPKDCLPKNIDSRETMFLTDDMVVVNIGFNQKFLSEEKIGMTIHFSNEGRDFFPNNLKMYAVKTDFSEYYNLEPQRKSSKKTFFGANVNKQVSSGNYYILIGFEHNNKTNWVKTTANVK